MTQEQASQVRDLCEKEILVALNRYEQLTDQKVAYVKFTFKTVKSIGKIKQVKIFDKEMAKYRTFDAE